MSLIFRQGCEDDLTAVYELNCDSFSESWSLKGLKDTLESGYELLICMDHEFLAGYLLSHDVLDEVHIMQVTVAPAYRRKGIAKQLNLSLMDAKQGKELLLEVRESNHPAQSLYAKLGFTRSGCRRAYYVSQQDDGIREDAVLMQYSR